jgi:hypothetical protein
VVFSSEADYLAFVKHQFKTRIASEVGQAAHSPANIRAAGFEPNLTPITEGPRTFVPDAMFDLRGNPGFYELKTSGYYYASFSNNIYPAVITAGRQGAPFTLQLLGNAAISQPLRRLILQVQKRFGGAIIEPP